jgi:uncharacterized repeat protein (TIGR03803 family)
MKKRNAGSASLSPNHSARKAVLLIIVLAAVNSQHASAQTYSVLYNFNNTSAQAPLSSSLALSGSTLYGMTNSGGGASFDGAIYSINTDGSGYTTRHNFSPADGIGITGSLVQSGSTFYGMAPQGGSHSLGTIFSYSPAGGLTVLHSFNVSDGDSPEGSLIVSGNMLYGMTGAGGGANVGTVFSMNTNGTNFTVLHSFADAPGDGAGPYYGSLTQSGTALYGMTAEGGAANRGAIFQMNTDGSGYHLVHSFAGGAGDGNEPAGSLAASGNMLYGMTGYGGTNNLGTIFSYNTQTGAYHLLYSFDGAHGETPQGDLTVVGNVLYGFALSGGAFGDGDIFSYDLGSNVLSILHSFDSIDGERPYAGSLTQVNNTFFGNTFIGGPDNFGVVFALTVPEPPSLLLLAFAGGTVILPVWRARSRV